MRMATTAGRDHRESEVPQVSRVLWVLRACGRKPKVKKVRWVRKDKSDRVGPISTVPGPQGPLGQAIFGEDGDDGWPILVRLDRQEWLEPQAARRTRAPSSIRRS